MSQSLISELREAAKAATSAGAWTIEPHGNGYALYSGRDGMHHGLNLLHITEPDWNWEANKRFLELCWPTNVTRLLDRIERLEGALTQALGILVEFGDLNGFRNLTDEELGRAVLTTAENAAAALEDRL